MLIIYINIYFSFIYLLVHVIIYLFQFHQNDILNEVSRAWTWCHQPRGMNSISPGQRMRSKNPFTFRPSFFSSSRLTSPSSFRFLFLCAASDTSCSRYSLSLLSLSTLSSLLPFASLPCLIMDAIILNPRRCKISGANRGSAPTAAVFVRMSPRSEREHNT